MQNALYVEISAIGIMLLVIILVTQRRTTGFSASQRRFNNLIYTLMAMLVIDAGCWLIGGTQFRFARELNYILETLYFCFQIIRNTVIIASQTNHFPGIALHQWQ